MKWKSFKLEKILTLHKFKFFRTVLTICGDEKGVSDAVTSASCQVED